MESLTQEFCIKLVNKQAKRQSELEYSLNAIERIS